MFVFVVASECRGCGCVGVFCGVVIMCVWFCLCFMLLALVMCLRVGVFSVLLLCVVLCCV